MSESSRTTESNDSDCSQSSLNSTYRMAPPRVLNLSSMQYDASLANVDPDISQFPPFAPPQCILTNASYSGSDIAKLDGTISKFYQYKKDPAQLTNVSYLVKEQLTNKPYAVISNEQKLSAERDSFRLVSEFVSSAGKRISIPSDIIRLFCSYYPLFYWSNEYILLKSAESSPVFMIPQACCDSSGCLRSFIHNESASSHTFNVDNIANDVLELFVRYIANVHYRELHARKKEAESAEAENWIFNMMNAQWKRAFVGYLSEEKLHQLRAAAMQMDCESLTDLTENRLQRIEEEKNYQHNNNIASILEAHFQST